MQRKSSKNGFKCETISEPYLMATGLPTYKIILCGEYGVGKSSIFRRFQNNTFTAESGPRSSLGLDQCTRLYDVNGAMVKLTLWDTGGMERMSFIGSSYYRGAQAALLCYSCNNRDSFNFLSQYILDIVMNAEGAKIFLCGNQADDEGSGDKVTETDLENFTRECENVLSGVYRISCRDNIGVTEMFRDIARVMHEDAMKRTLLPTELVIKPGETPELPNGKKRCC